jgi:uncharacterized protein YbaP (TraB family)
MLNSTRNSIVLSVGLCLIALICLSTYSWAGQKKIFKARPALWQIQGNKIPANNKIYLFGSYSLLPNNLQWYEGKVKEAFEGSDELVLEVIVTDAIQEEATRMVVKHGVMKNKRKSISRLINRKRYKKLIKYSKKLLKIQERIVKALKPWVLSNELIVERSRDFGIDLNDGAGRVLRSKAIEKKIPITGLETLREIWGMFMDLDLDLQVKMLNSTIDDLDDFNIELNDFIKVWASGDKNRITEKFMNEMNKYEGLIEPMILDRNHYWMPVLEKFFRNGKNTFLSVNITNLIGPYSLIRILEDDGYKVTKVQ